MLREARFVWKQRGGVPCSRLGCFHLGCPLLARGIAVFNLPRVRVHPGSSLLLVRGAPRPVPAGAAVRFSSHLRRCIPGTGLLTPPVCARGAVGSSTPSPAVPGSEKGCRCFQPTDVSVSLLLS